MRHKNRILILLLVVAALGTFMSAQGVVIEKADFKGALVNLRLQVASDASGAIAINSARGGEIVLQKIASRGEALPTITAGSAIPPTEMAYATIAYGEQNNALELRLSNLNGEVSIELLVISTQMEPLVLRIQGQEIALDFAAETAQ
jgi:hypothetical protein